MPPKALCHRATRLVWLVLGTWIICRRSSLHEAGGLRTAFDLFEAKRFLFWAFGCCRFSDSTLLLRLQRNRVEFTSLRHECFAQQYGLRQGLEVSQVGKALIDLLLRQA